MDRALYIAMTGARDTLERQTTISQNLANASSTGYRSQSVAFRSLPVFNQFFQTRTYAVESTTGSDFAPGILKETGRSLDVAIQGKGWFVVKDAKGDEAYTRAGHLQLDTTGEIRAANGLSIQSEGNGAIVVPPNLTVSISRDGTVEGVNPANVTERQTLGRIKLVNPDEAELVRGDDGLFRLKSGDDAPAANNQVALSAGSLEGSNVNVVESLVQMISSARQFDMQMKMIQNLDADAKASTQLLNIAG